MKVVFLLSIFFSLALFHGGQGLPCMKEATMEQHTTFHKHHVLKEEIEVIYQKNTNEIDEEKTNDKWRIYLEKEILCGRQPVQTFINSKYKREVDEICTGDGARLSEGDGNLCISKKHMEVYDVESAKGKKCVVTKVTTAYHFVIVGCEKVENRFCGPFHYQKYEGQEPGKIPCTNA